MVSKTDRLTLRFFGYVLLLPLAVPAYLYVAGAAFVLPVVAVLVVLTLATGSVWWGSGFTLLWHGVAYLTVMVTATAKNGPALRWAVVFDGAAIIIFLLSYIITL